MKLSEFEKRHGKIGASFASNHWNSRVADKYGITLSSKDTDLPAHIWHIMQNMATYRSHPLQSVQNIFQYLTSEPRKEVRDLFLKNLDGLFFADYWGYFSRHDPKDYKFEDKKEYIKVLRCIKDGFKKYKYFSDTTRNRYIDSLILEWRTPDSKIENFKYATSKLNHKSNIKRATEKIQNADKLPRKLKKQVKKGFFGQLFVRDSK